MESKSTESLSIGQLASKSSVEKVILPEYPVIDREPSNSLTLANFRFSDYVKAVAIPSFMTTAYYIGSRHHRVTTAVWAAITFPTLYFIQYDNVQQRLKGFRENQSECEKYNITFKKTGL